REPYRFPVSCRINSTSACRYGVPSGRSTSWNHTAGSSAVYGTRADADRQHCSHQEGFQSLHHVNSAGTRAASIPGATAASGAGFTPAERAGGLGGAPLAPQEPQLRAERDFTPAERAGGLGGAPLAPPSSPRRIPDDQRLGVPRGQRPREV